jgi:phosphoesterase RecJ-like protein
MILNKIGNIIKQNKSFAVVSHIIPDGDAIGSTLGLYNFLSEIGKDVDVFNPDKLPSKFNFLPGFFDVKDTLVKRHYDCIFVLDCSDKDRLGHLVELLNMADVVINIDHHISNDLFADINYVDTNAGAVGEIIYNLIRINGFEISYNTAMCLYTSIVTDTGGFKYSNTTSMTLNIAGDLINTGIDFPEINRILFDTLTAQQVKLLSRVTSTLELYNNNSIAMLHVTKDMLEECGANENDASEMVNYARDIDTVEVGVFIKEVEKGKFRVSLRSKNKIDVRIIAEKFNGGGHIRAAGCTVYGDFDEVKNKVLNEIINHWK